VLESFSNLNHGVSILLGRMVASLDNWCLTFLDSMSLMFRYHN